MPIAQPRRNLPAWIWMLVLAGVIALSFLAPNGGVETIGYSQFEELLSQNKVARVSIHIQAGRLRRGCALGIFSLRSAVATQP